MIDSLNRLKGAFAHRVARLRRALGLRGQEASATPPAATKEPASVSPYEMSDIPVRADFVRYHRAGDEGYLTHERGRSGVHLNKTASTLWRTCDGTRTAEQIIKHLAWTFGEDEQALAADVLAALRHLEMHGMLSRAHSLRAPPVSKSGTAGTRPAVHGIGWARHHPGHRDLEPKLFDWTDSKEAATAPVTIVKVHWIVEAMELPGPKIAWLGESPAITQMQRLDQFVLDNLDDVLKAYDFVLSPDRAFCEIHDRFLYHPANSNLPWINEKHYRIYAKSKLCSMFASNKLMVEGHHVRHDYARKFKDRIDLFGGAFDSPIITSEGLPLDKREGLAPYMFTIAMENCQTSLYYTEKLIDCFVTGTVPVYWGSDDICEIFDERGIIMLNDDFDLSTLTPDLYRDMLPYIKNNFEIACALEGADDELYRKYIKAYAQA